MTYNQFVKAYNVMRKLVGMDFNVRDAFAIFKLYKEIDPTVQFGLERENALIKKYDGRLQPNGDIQFVHGDSDEARETGIANMQKFKDEMDDLGEMEIEAEITPVKLGYDSFGNQKISPAEIMDLEGFIVFE